MTDGRFPLFDLEAFAELAELAERDGGRDGAIAAKRIRSRSCGSCTECCTRKGVWDLPGGPKPAGFRCPLLRMNPPRCTVHATKPQSCADYLCAWRLGAGTDGSRPDLADVIVDLHDTTSDNAVMRRYAEQHLSRGEPMPIVCMGAVVRAEGPYEVHPVRRILDDLWRMGIRYFGFVGIGDEDGQPLIWTNDPARIKSRLGYHAGRGRAPWNRRDDAGVPSHVANGSLPELIDTEDEAR